MGSDETAGVGTIKPGVDGLLQANPLYLIVFINA
jgi:hypothetical protein